MGLAVLAAMTVASACAEPGSPERKIVGADSARGLALIGEAGCAACHVVPGVDWPKGSVGGSLAGFADRPLITGELPNRPDNLIAWLRDPPAHAPATAMPPSALSPAQARDVAAYLYTLHGR